MDFPDVFAERLETYRSLIFRKDKIYTHPKVAAAFLVGLKIKMSVSTHSHPKVAAPWFDPTKEAQTWFQHTLRRTLVNLWVSTHSRPKAAASSTSISRRYCWFQHTAARRRLPDVFLFVGIYRSFNTQPPEGGCSGKSKSDEKTSLFQHTAARRRLPARCYIMSHHSQVSTHSRPKAAA